jgi:hypothetical protein
MSSTVLQTKGKGLAQPKIAAGSFATRTLLAVIDMQLPPFSDVRHLQKSTNVESEGYLAAPQLRLPSEQHTDSAYSNLVRPQGIRVQILVCMKYEVIREV